MGNPMRLELATFPIRDVRFSDATRLKDGVLFINREELRRLLLESGDFADVGLEVVHPGDARRVIHVMDAAEPRVKVGPGVNFPGLVDRPSTVGYGRSHRLAGMAVISVGEPVAGEATYWREAVIDMSGPGAALTPFGTLVNLVLEFKPLPKHMPEAHPEGGGTENTRGSALSDRYNRNVRVAELKAAVYLASVTEGLTPDSVAVYESTPAAASLPRVAYLYQNGCAVYGHSVSGALPTLVHPNEILDGALVPTHSNSHASTRDSTFLMQNHATVRELYAHHGVDLNFVGAVIFAGAATDPEKLLDKKEMLTEYVVKLAGLLQADAAVLCGSGGGHATVDFMMAVQKCERAGITTVQMMPEAYGTPEDPGFVHFLPEAKRIVSTGRSPQLIELPAMAEVLGGTKFFDLPDAPGDRMEIPYRYLYGCMSATGYGRLTARAD